MEPAELSLERAARLGILTARLGLAPPSSFALIHQALIHRSWAVEHASSDNERLEFLGDSVISLATAEYLHDSRPQASEGELSQLRASMVSRKILGKVALELGLGELLLLGVGEESSGGRKRLSILGSALEALCGALHQLYPWETLRPAIRREVLDPALHLVESRTLVDYKSRLQEWTQKNLQAVPAYSVTASQGPDHKKEFVVEVWVGGQLVAQGRGARKKWAENEAARQALEIIEGGWSPPRREVPGTDYKI